MGAVISHLQDGISAISTILSTLSALNAKYQSLLQRLSSDPGLPVANPTASYWMQDAPFPEICDIQNDVPEEADVVIIGSGITAAAAAKTLCELEHGGGVKIVVLEARQLCSGATARNGGHIKCSPHDEFSRLRKHLGEEKARKVVRLQMRHLEALKEVGEEIPCGEVREVETVDLYLQEENFEEGKKSVEGMREWMPEVEVEFWGGEKAREKFGANQHVVGALSYKAGALWPYRLITGVWNDLIKRYPSLAISTHTPVEDITTNNSSSTHPYKVHTSRGIIKARHILHATNGYAAHLIPALRGRLTGVIGHMTAQRPGQDFPPCHGQRSWSVMYLPGFDYVTQRPDGEDGSPGDVMLGGGLFRSKDEGMDQIGVWDDSKTDPFPVMHLRGSMATIFEPKWGVEGGLKKSWSGIMGFTGDMMPLVGPLPRMKGVPGGPTQTRGGTNSSGQWIAAGFNGEGMVWAWLSGTAVAIMMLGREEEDLQKGVGRPGGKLEEWFPREEVRVDEARLKRADLKNLAGEVM